MTSLPLSFRGIPIGVPKQRAALESLCLETAKRKEYCSEITPDQDKHLVDVQFGNLHVPLLDTRIGADGAVNFVRGYGRNDELIQLATSRREIRGTEEGSVDGAYAYRGIVREAYVQLD